VREPDGSFVSDALLVGRGAQTAVAAFIDALQRLNLAINGSKPSETIADDKELPIHLVYAVAEVSRMLRAEGLDDLAWDADTAWLAVLAGDIDDLQEHVAFERNAKG